MESINRICPGCLSRLPGRMRLGTIFCSTRCRVRAHRAAAPQFPSAMRERVRWVRRDSAKCPLQTNGRRASSTNAYTWTTYAKARDSSVGVGLGFILEGTGIACVDVDHCLTNGSLTPQAEKLLRLAGATYVTVSQSGTGLHIWGYGRLDHGRKTAIDGQSVEAYSSGRYIAATGQLFRDAPVELASIQPLLSLVARR